MPSTRPGSERSPPGSWPPATAASSVTRTPMTGAPLAVLPAVDARTTSGSRSTPPAAPSARWAATLGRGARRGAAARARPRARPAERAARPRPARVGQGPLARVRGGRRLRDRGAALRPARARRCCARPGTSGVLPGAVPGRSSTTGPRASSASSRPWNYPLSLAVTDAIPALLAGNAVVLRPDLQASLTALRGRRDLRGRRAARGPAAGRARRRRAHRAGRRRPRRLRQLHRLDRHRPPGRRRPPGGGWSASASSSAARTPCTSPPTPTCDRAAAGAVRACFASAGQLCISAERLVVHADVYDEFVPRFVEQVGADAAVDRPALGRRHGLPASAPAQKDKVLGHVDDARRQGRPGAHRRPGAPRHRPARLEPTVLEGVTSAMALPRRGDLRPGRVALPGRLRRRGRARWPTTPSTASTPRLDARRAPRARGSRPGSTPARSTSTRATPRPGAASPPRWAG